MSKLNHFKPVLIRIPHFAPYIIVESSLVPGSFVAIHQSPFNLMGCCRIVPLCGVALLLLRLLSSTPTSMPKKRVKNAATTKGNGWWGGGGWTGAKEWNKLHSWHPPRASSCCSCWQLVVMRRLVTAVALTCCYHPSHPLPTPITTAPFSGDSPTHPFLHTTATACICICTRHLNALGKLLFPKIMSFNNKPQINIYWTIFLKNKWISYI